jgi:hypothetical protein
MYRFALRLLIVLMVAGIPALADFVPVGVPRPVGSWAQLFEESGVGDFNRVEFTMDTPGIAFGTPSLFNFTDSAWSVYFTSSDSRQSAAYGPAVQVLQFDVHFPDTPAVPLAFSFTAWNNDVFLELVNGSWNGSSWTMTTTSENCLTPRGRPKPLPSSVPEPGGTLVIFGASMVGLLAMLKRELKSA